MFRIQATDTTSHSGFRPRIQRHIQGSGHGYNVTMLPRMKRAVESINTVSQQHQPLAQKASDRPFFGCLCQHPDARLVSCRRLEDEIFLEFSCAAIGIADVLARCSPKMLGDEIFDHEGQERKLLDLFDERRESEGADEHITAGSDAVEATLIRRLLLSEWV
jgi:hypothetical protein